jgi:hypothetical protein
MHQNEIKITTDNVAELLKIASELSESHVAALDEQITRQAQSK